MIQLKPVKNLGKNEFSDNFRFFIRLRTVRYKKTKKLRLKIIENNKIFKKFCLGRGEALKNKKGDLVNLLLHFYFTF